MTFKIICLSILVIAMFFIGYIVGKIEGRDEKMMDDRDNEVCGTCRFHKRDGDFPDDFICVNPDSDNVGDWTEYTDTCEEWERR